MRRADARAGRFSAASKPVKGKGQEELPGHARTIVQTGLQRRIELNDFQRAGTPTMIQVHKLIGSRNMPDNIETAHGFLPGCADRRPGGRKSFSAERIFCPEPSGLEIFKRIWVFDQDVH